MYVRCLLFRETRRKRNGRRAGELLETASIFKLVRSRAEEEKETALSEFVRLKIYPMRVVYQAAPVPPFHPLPQPQPRFHPPLFPREFALSIFFFSRLSFLFSIFLFVTLLSFSSRSFFSPPLFLSLSLSLPFFFSPPTAFVDYFVDHTSRKTNEIFYHRVLCCNWFRWL